LQFIQIHNKKFELIISEKALKERTRKIAEEINKKYQGEELSMVGILNGSFRFFATLVDYLNISIKVIFIRVHSYKAEGRGKINEVFGLKNNELQAKKVLIVEDIIDSGHTLTYIKEKILEHQPFSLETATLLCKPEAVETNVELEYIGFEIGPQFVVGYGLDYDGLGRELNGIYMPKRNS